MNVAGNNNSTFRLRILCTRDTQRISFSGNFTFEVIPWKAQQLFFESCIDRI